MPLQNEECARRKLSLGVVFRVNTKKVESSTKKVYQNISQLVNSLKCSFCYSHFALVKPGKGGICSSKLGDKLTVILYQM